MKTDRTPTLRRARRTRLTLAVVGVLVVAGGLVGSSLSFAAATAATQCSGASPTSPGVLTGTTSGNVVVTGFCAVNKGPATVNGSITVSPGGVLVSAFGQQSSGLTVTGNVTVDKGASAILGCFPSSFPCVDDPNMKHPTLKSPVKVKGSLIATKALGVVVHDAKIGKVSETGGGGGENCKVSSTNVFGSFKSPAYSDYEDDSVAKGVTIKNVRGCWLGVLRVKIGGSVALKGNHLADPDAIEIGDNRIHGNLACTGNTTVWDSSEIHKGLYPRVLKLNKVGGKRSGQCAVSSPTAKGGPSGTHPF